MKKIIYSLIISVFLTATVFCDDNALFDVTSAIIEPNVLIIFDTSGSMDEKINTGSGHEKKKIRIAKQAIKQVINDYGATSRLGLMRFTGREGGEILVKCSVKEDYIVNGTLQLDNYKNFLKGKVNSLSANGSTPLAESLAEAGRYFEHKSSLFNTTGYTSGDDPFSTWCRKSYIILMTDGKPQFDDDTNKLSYITASSDYPKEDGNYFYDSEKPELHDVAAYLYDNDLRTGASYPGKQNVTTYTIGFSLTSGSKEVKLLQDTADRGQGKGNTSKADDGGVFVSATNPQELGDAFESFFNDIAEKNTTFESASTPISDDNKAYTGDDVYLSMFKPVSGGRWNGNIKKYKLNADNQLCSPSATGAGSPIIDSNGNVKDSAKDGWNSSDEADGGKVVKGGVGYLLKDRDYSNRIFYTNKGVEPNGDLAAFTADLFSDLEQANVDKITRKGAEWPLGDFNHSKPAVLSVGSGDAKERYIFAGSNDGLLHCFKDSNGNEEWAFYPENYSSRASDFENTTHNYFLDGSPVVSKDGSSTLLLVGERRGGNHYYCLDVSSISSPKYKYTHSTCAGAGGASNGGQSWKTPQAIKVKTGTNTVENVFLLTGGYDANYDSNSSYDNAKGYSVYAITQSNGTIVSGLNFDLNTLSSSKNSCVAAFASDTIDDGQDVMNIILAGDMEGNLYGFRDDDPVSASAELDGTWMEKHLFSITGAVGKKIFAEADFVVEPMRYYAAGNGNDAGSGTWQQINGEYIFFGTGDRADPLDTTIVNYFYCVKNDWKNTSLTIDKTVDNYPDLELDFRADASKPEDKKLFVDATDIEINQGAYSESTQKIVKHTGYFHNRGWYIKLEGQGEKCLSTPVTFDGVVYFTTFTPSAGSTSSTDVCVSASASGTTKVYAVNYKTGLPAFNLDTTNDTEDGEVLKNNDRAVEISSEMLSIPPSPKIIITENGPALILGPLSIPKDITGAGANIKLVKKDEISVIYWKIQ